MTSTATSAPAWRDLFRGAVREALAAANCVARIGTQDTRAWERPISYVADDNHGNVGVVEFHTDGAIAAMSARAPLRVFDESLALRAAPPAAKANLGRARALPLLNEGGGVSAVFWTAGEFIEGPESWPDICRHGAEVFHRELLPDSTWQVEATAHYGLAPDVARLAITLAMRAVIRVPLLEMSEAELQLLIPKESDHIEEALDLLFSDSLFVVRQSSAR